MATINLFFFKRVYHASLFSKLDNRQPLCSAYSSSFSSSLSPSLLIHLSTSRKMLSLSPLCLVMNKVSSLLYAAHHASTATGTEDTFFFLSTKSVHVNEKSNNVQVTFACFTILTSSNASFISVTQRKASGRNSEAQN